MSTSINDLYSKADIESMKAGNTVSKTIKETPKGSVVKPSVSIRGNDDLPSQGGGWGDQPAGRISAPGTGVKVTRPATLRDSEGNVTETKIVSAPNIDRFTQAAAQRALEKIEADEARKVEASKLDPEKLLASLNALDRQVRKLQKQIKTLEGKTDA